MAISNGCIKCVVLGGREKIMTFSSAAHCIVEEQYTIKNEVLTQHFLGCVYACLNTTLQGC